MLRDDVNYLKSSSLSGEKHETTKTLCRSSTKTTNDTCDSKKWNTTAQLESSQTNIPQYAQLQREHSQPKITWLIHLSRGTEHPPPFPWRFWKVHSPTLKNQYLNIPPHSLQWWYSPIRIFYTPLSIFLKIYSSTHFYELIPRGLLGTYNSSKTKGIWQPGLYKAHLCAGCMDCERSWVALIQYHHQLTAPKDI